ncbi:MAG TPA: CHAT domain-containing protein, partial [Candidatus Polarisedimenticolaceae bacterium]|nr:CHAT domain-containing protein [Candidatus Polarisedimenticolaceae bacterium]
LAALRRLERDYLERFLPAAVEPEQLRRALPPGTAYVGWLHSPVGNRFHRSAGPVLEGAWLFVIRPEAPLRWIPLWTARSSAETSRHMAALEACHQRYEAASEWPLRVAEDPGLERAAREAWSTWLAPAMPYLEGVRRLIVEYSGEFPRVPLESLVDAAGRPLAERFACSYSPSATTYLWLSRRAEKPALARRPALAVGGAVYSAHATGSVPPPLSTTVLDPVLLRKALSGDPVALDQLPALPYSLEEARTVAALFPGSRLLTGAAGSERRLGELARAGRLADFGVIHLATHTLSECHPERSALALSRLDLDGTAGGDGLLRSRELLDGWQLSADLLVLSGCQSARSCAWDDGEYVGFTQALMAVGARSVVASLWKVDDRATALLMERFYRDLTGRIDGERRRPLPRDLALAEAKRWLRDLRGADGTRPFAHPVYWAGFVLFGPGD